MKKILVIDGNSILNRAFYGIRPLTTKAGKHTNAIFGMVNMVGRQMAAIMPDYAAVAFDLKAPTFRHKMYDAYKVGRHPTPPELSSQFPDAKEVLRAMGLHVLELEGYEADDIQGTVAKMAHAMDDAHGYVFSGDRDLLQLIDDRVTVLLATNSDTLVMDEAAFVAKYGIPPAHLTDMKGLMGDSSDNIPGVAGVGEKTAQGLLTAFSTLDGIYENIEDSRIKPGVRQKLIDHKDEAYLSKTLATINTNVPLNIKIDDIAYNGLQKQALREKFNELELNSFIQRFHLDEEEIEAIPCEQRETAILEFKEASADDVNALTGRAAILPYDGGYLFSTGGDVLLYKGVLSALRPFFEAERELVCMEAKELWHTLDGAGIRPAVSLLDLSLYAYVLNPGGKGSTLASMVSMFLNEAASDASLGPCHLLRLEPVLRERVKEAGGEKVLFDLELPLITVLAKMEKAGLMIDIAGMQEFGEALLSLSEDLASRIYMQAGEVFNINSPKQLGEVLYVKMGLEYKKKKTKSGFSTDAQTLEEIRHLNPIIDDILEYRQVTKLHSTYTEALVRAADDEHRVHTDFKQALTATGRLSSTEPNLQNIPIRTKMGRQMRKYFIAREGYALVDADYSQIELRLLAHIADDYHMIEAFKSGEDIHRKTAAAVFGIPEEDVTDEMRKKAKAVNFGIVYGISGFSLSKDIGTTVPEATRYIKNYMYNYPSVDRYLEEVVERAKADGYTETPMGRRRYIPELNAANGVMRAFGKRIAMNAPIQGAAADIMKCAMIRVAKRLEAEDVDATLVMQVHDELLVEARLADVARVKDILREEMESAASLSVPMTVDVTSGKNWLDQE
ncbi:MAG: DNA polymerase I [Clostridia bacterium]|nr:DNA polymerase I [Clostridia bacterium]